MIALTAEKNADTVAQICGKEGTPATEQTVVYTAKDKEEILGYLIFEVSDRLRMINIVTEPLLWNSLGDGLFRAGLNYACEHGISGAVIEKPLFERLKGNIIPDNIEEREIKDCEKFLQSIKRCKG